MMYFKKITLCITLGFVFLFAGLLQADPNTSTSSGDFVNGAVAIVNSDVVSYQELMDATDQTITQAKIQNQPLPNRLTVEQHVLQTLIMQKIALQLAALNNISVDSKQVKQVIAGIAKQNNISTEQLYAKLSSQGVEQRFYENTIRTQMVVQQLEQAEVANAIVITPSQIDNYLAAQARAQNVNTEYEVAHILVALPDNPTANDYAKAKTKAEMVLSKINGGMNFTVAAETNSDSSDASTGGNLGYQTIAQLPTAFIEPITSMSVGEVKGPIPTDSGFNLIKLLDKRGGQASVPHYVTEYHLQTILIKSSPILSNDQVKAQLQRIKLALANGKSFSDLAKAYSEDYFTSQNGGDMGWVNPVKLNPTLAAYVTSAPMDQVSNPIQTTDGWYLVKILGAKQVDDTAAYNRQQAEQALFQQKASEALQAWQAQIKSMSYIVILDPSLKIPSDNDSGS